MMTADEALALTESAGFSDTAKAILAAEVRRLRDEVNGLTGSLERAESVLQNLMSFLSVNGCRTEIDPENAELRIRDGINMLVRPALERAELAENALKEAQEQEPVAWINLNKWTPSNGPQCVTHEEYEKERELLTKLTAVYAAPVPAVAAPAVPEGWREVVNAMVEWWDDQHMTMEQGREIRNKARALLQSTEPRP